MAKSTTTEKGERTFKIEDPAIAPFYLSCDENNFSIYKDLPSGYRPLAIGHYSTLVGALRKVQQLKVVEQCIEIEGSVTLAMYIDVLATVSQQISNAFPQIQLNVVAP